jgi:hypothetical protein
MREGQVSLEINRQRIPEGSDPDHPQLEPGRWERLPYGGAPPGSERAKSRPRSPWRRRATIPSRPYSSAACRKRWRRDACW